MNNGIPVPAAILPAPELLAEFDLPSGKHCTIRKGVGKDLRLALMAAGQKADQYRITYALLARLARVDEQMITMESIDAMDLFDAQTMLAEGGKALSPLRRARLSLMTTEALSHNDTSSQPEGLEHSLNGESLLET